MSEDMPLTRQWTMFKEANDAYRKDFEARYTEACHLISSNKAGEALIKYREALALSIAFHNKWDLWMKEYALNNEVSDWWRNQSIQEKCMLLLGLGDAEFMLWHLAEAQRIFESGLDLANNETSPEFLKIRAAFLSCLNNVQLLKNRLSYKYIPIWSWKYDKSFQ